MDRFAADNTRELTAFKALSFDCYGTLIEWERNLQAALQPITDELSPSHHYREHPDQLVKHFDSLSNNLEESQPSLPYDRNLATAMRQLAAELHVTTVSDAAFDAMARGPGSWPAFEDTIAALRVLKKHYKLIILSNIDNANMQRTLAGPLGGVEFDAVYTAQDIGSYKPSSDNFEYLFRRAREELGVKGGKESGEILHVARSLTVDHTAAKRMGFPSCWIARGGDRKGGEGIGGDYEKMLEEGEVSFQWKFDTLGDFAKEVARQFGDE